jgi:hypothetical protein
MGCWSRDTNRTINAGPYNLGAALGASLSEEWNVLYVIGHWFYIKKYWISKDRRAKLRAFGAKIVLV